MGNKHGKESAYEESSSGSVSDGYQQPQQQQQYYHSASVDVLETIVHPDNEQALRQMFAQFDKNNSGSLDLEEWKSFAHYLWKAVVEEPLNDAEKQVRPSFARCSAAFAHKLRNSVSSSA